MESETTLYAFIVDIYKLPTFVIPNIPFSSESRHFKKRNRCVPLHHVGTVVEIFNRRPANAIENELVSVSLDFAAAREHHVNSPKKDPCSRWPSHLLLNNVNATNKLIIPTKFEYFSFPFAAVKLSKTTMRGFHDVAGQAVRVGSVSGSKQLLCHTRRILCNVETSATLAIRPFTSTRTSSFRTGQRILGTGVR